MDEDDNFIEFYFFFYLGYCHEKQIFFIFVINVNNVLNFSREFIKHSKISTTSDILSFSVSRKLERMVFKQKDF